MHTKSSEPATPILAWILVTVLALGVAACSSSDDTTDTTAAAGTTTAAATTEPAPEPITIVVTNDDGIEAPGIDELARRLGELEAVTVKVVAPATNQSGTGDSTSDGDVTHEAAATASGIEGVAVNGTPADSVNVALGELGLEPDLIVSGINKGQNAGPLVDISGTVGAALTSARQGVPAIAGSAGLEDPDYALAAQYVVEWVVQNRDLIASGDVDTDQIVNINVPECTAGTAYELVEVATAEEIPEGVNPFSTDCSATPEGHEPTDDIDALANGFAVRSTIPTG